MDTIKMHFAPIFKAIAVSIGLSIIFFLFLSCHKDEYDNEDYDKIVKETEINQEFEQFPPIVKDIEVQVLQEPLGTGENMRVVAAFENENQDDRFLALNLGNKKVALRDDGKGADERANDNRFSIFIKEDIELLAKELDRRKEMILSKQAPTFTFESRLAIPIDVESVERLDIDQIKNNGIIEIPRDILFPNLPIMIRHEKSLTISASSVVEDPNRTFDPCSQTGNPNGVWTFGSLMRQMASTDPSSIATDAEVSDFVLNWLNTWDQTIAVNGQNLGPRLLVDEYVVQPWLERSLIAGAPQGQLQMEFAPFRLEAIVNRLDLRGNSGYGFSNAGEGRFLFDFIHSGFCYSEFGPNGPGTASEGRFTVILEYGINKTTCAEIKAYGQEWADLSTMIPGTAAYNNALQHITDQFTLSGTNTSKPNQSSINQIRTNEFFGVPVDWELREFHLNSAGSLFTVPVQMEPGAQYNSQSSPSTGANGERFATYVNSRALQIAANRYVVPETIPATPGTTTPVIPFLGRASFNPDFGVGPLQYWDGTGTPGPGYINNDEARHIFSLNTCSGCHAKETNTNFVQINSGFLTGITVTDPANRPSNSPASRTFNDLARREMDLSNLINGRCIDFGLLDLSKTLLFRPLNMTH